MTVKRKFITVLIIALLFTNFWGCISTGGPRLTIDEKVEKAVSLIPQMDSREFRDSIKDYLRKESQKSFAVDPVNIKWGRSWGYQSISDAKRRAMKHTGTKGVFLFVNNVIQEKNFNKPISRVAYRKEGVHRVGEIGKPLDDSKLFPTEPILSLETGMHTAMINRMGIDPLGNFLITPSDDKTLRMWNLRNGELMKTFRIPVGKNAEGAMIQSAAVSPDGKRVAIGVMKSEWEDSSSIIIINLKTRKIEKKIKGIPDVPLNLDYSDDGLYLAASMYRKGGVQVYQTSDYSVVFQDTQYNDTAYGLDFSSRGSLVVASKDKFVRLYSRQFKLISKKKIKPNSDAFPYHVKFNKNGSLIAVGIANSIQVSILSGKNLSIVSKVKAKPKHAPNHVESLWAVAWANSGKYLYAGGRLKEKNDAGDFVNYIYRWDVDSFNKKPKKIQTDNATITSLQPYATNAVAYGTTDPSWGIINSDGIKQIEKLTPLLDSRANKSCFLLSSDGLTVSYFKGFGENQQATFSLIKGHLKQPIQNMYPPNMKSTKINILNWNQEYNPILNGEYLKEITEETRCYALTENGEYALIGTAVKLYAYDKNGNLMWQRWARGETWGLNIAKESNLFIASYSDGTIRWHDLATGDELLAFFPHADGKRWVIWTPEGFFDHSPGGEELIGYHLNVEKDKLAQFVNISQVYNLFYRPDLVRKKMDKKFQADISAELSRIGDIRTVIDKGLPPQLEILRPSRNAQLENAEVEIAVKLIEKGGGGGKVIFKLNGIPVSEANVTLLKGSGNEKTIQRKLHLDAGENIIQVTAYNEFNQIESEPAAIVLNTPQVKSRKGDVYILSIGIDDYKNDYFDLSFAVNDSLEVLNAFNNDVCDDLFRDIKKIKLLNSDATRVNIKQTIKTLGSKLTEDDLFVFYVATHGYTFNGRFYLLPWEADYINDESEIKSIGLATDELEDLLLSIPAKKSLILLDTCNGEGFTKDVYRLLSQQAALGRFVRNSGRAILSASTEKQPAQEGYRGHGLFTYVLLDGLKGGADRHGDRNRIISTIELANYTIKRVPEISKRIWNIEQDPSFKYYGKDFSLVKSQ